MTVTEGKWTCEGCHRTVTVYASEQDAACCLRAVQERHTQAHRAAAVVLGRLGLPPRPRKRAA